MGTWEFTFVSFDAGDGVNLEWLWGASVSSLATTATLYYRAIDQAGNFEDWKTLPIGDPGVGVGDGLN